MSNRDALKHLGNVTSATRAIAGEIADHLTSLGYTLPRYGSPYSGPVMHGYANGSEHGTGRAIDVMVMSPGAMGDAVAEFVWKHRERYDLVHVIWKQRIRSTRNSYGVWRGMDDRGSGTNNHMDHPHIFLGVNAKPLGSSGGAQSAPKPATTKYYQPKGVSMTVKQIQAAAGTTADGYYGDDTKAAVKKLQQKLGVTADGLFGPVTEAAYNASKGKASTPKPAKKKLVEDGLLGRLTVMELQRFLKVTVDGKRGRQTNAALQKWLGVKQDGVVGKRTVAALQRKVGARVDSIWGKETTRKLQRFLNKQ